MVNFLNQTGAKGSIAGAELVNKDEASAYAGYVMAGSYIRPFKRFFYTFYHASERAVPEKRAAALSLFYREDSSTVKGCAVILRMNSAAFYYCLHLKKRSLFHIVIGQNLSFILSGEGLEE